MIRNKRIQLTLFAASILASILIMVLRGRELNFGEVLGGGVGLMLVPFLIAMLTKWIVKAFKKSFTDKAFLTVFLFGWVLLMLVNIWLRISDLSNPYYQRSPLSANE